MTDPTTTPGTMPPDMVNAIVRDMDDPRYPSQITVFCDHCGTEDTADYMVSEDMTPTERLAVARQHLVEHKGWQHDADTGDDFCPEHAAPKPSAPDCPYTDEDLRAEAARLHARAARDTDGKIYQAVQRRWGSQLDVDQLDETGDALLEVLDRAADTSRWAVDLGADQLQPGTRAIDIGWNNGPLMARIHISYAANMPDDEREQLVTDLSNAIAATVPVR
jgi:hypothetical protein